MKAFKKTVVPLLALLCMLAGTGCASEKKSCGKSKGWVYNSANSHHSKSKLKYKI